MTDTKVQASVSLPPAVADFAKKMAASQGCLVKVTKEARGYQLYLPCPDCLWTHGKKELADPKYAINLTKHLGLTEDDSNMMFEDWNEIERTRDNRSGVCMRTRSQAKPHMFKVTDLLAMDTVSQRHPDIMTRAEVMSTTDQAERESHWEPDSTTGVLCPPSPGLLIPLHDLPADHVGRKYIEDRHFELQRLWDMFQTCWCTQEYPYGKNGIFYRRMPGQWKDTSQGRVIFHGLVNNTPMIWQARVIDRLSEDGLLHYYWHPYQNRWDLVETRSHNKGVWMRQPPFDELNELGHPEWDPAKYKTAKFSNRFPGGWDAAVRNSKDCEYSWCCLTEGPLDAGRIGPGGMPVFGSSLSPEAAEKIVNTFQIVLTAFDNDAPGVAATASIHRTLNAVNSRNPAMLELAQMTVPSGKDLGEMQQDRADELLKVTLNRIKRNL